MPKMSSHVNIMIHYVLSIASCPTCIILAFLLTSSRCDYENTSSLKDLFSELSNNMFAVSSTVYEKLLRYASFSWPSTILGNWQNAFVLHMVHSAQTMWTFDVALYFQSLLMVIQWKQASFVSKNIKSILKRVFPFHCTTFFMVIIATVVGHFSFLAHDTAF